MGLIDKLPKGLTRAVGNLWLKTKKSSPEICVISGIVCGAGALVLVGINTWKNKDKISDQVKVVKAYTTEYVEIDEETAKDLNKAQAKKVITNAATGNMLVPVKIPYKNMTKEHKEQLASENLTLAKDILVTYGPPLLLEGASIFLIWKGRTILRKNLSAMTAAYAALTEAFRKYRQRVADKYGKEVDEEMALGYKVEERVDENGNVEKVVTPEANGNLNPFGFWLNGGFFDDVAGEYICRNDKWWDNCKDKNQLILMVKNEQEQATRELRTIGYWRLGDTMKRLGYPPKEARKFYDYGKVYKEGGENRVSFGVLDDDDQLMCNKGFTNSFCSQNVCYINPNVDGYIGYINDELEKYDFRYGRCAKKELPYKSYKREANKLIERYNTELMERMVFNKMSDSGKRRMAKIIK